MAPASEQAVSARSFLLVVSMPYVSRFLFLKLYNECDYNTGDVPLLVVNESTDGTQKNILFLENEPRKFVFIRIKHNRFRLF